MGKALMMRRGAGGNDLNFRVHVGLEEPSVLMENTIWIATDIDVPEWVIAPTNPYLAYKDVNLMSDVYPTSGVLGSNGNAGTANTTYKEVYTEDYIPVEYGKKYTYEYGLSAEKSLWLAVCEYTSDRAVVSRTVLVNGVTDVLATGVYTPSQSTVEYVRLTWRTYGDIGAGVILTEPNVEYTPDSVAYGTVWIQMSEGGSATINALRSNALMLTLADVQSLIGLDPFGSGERMWMALTGYVYQNGEWVKIEMRVLTLYKTGDPCSSVTGGWTKSSGTLNMNTDSMKLAGNGAVAHTVNQIRVTNYSTLRFSVIAESASAVTIIGVGPDVAANSFTASVTLPFGVTGYTEFDVDVSGLTGEYYVKIQTHASSLGCSVREVTLL